MSKFWLVFILLLCPLMHFLMMRKHKHGGSCGHKADDKNSLYKCPECGFLYKEKKWAEKCEAWCKKYKTCNLEITKYAVKK